MENIGIGVSFPKKYKDIDMIQEHLVADSRLLQKLNTSINAGEVVSSISRLTKEVEKIEAFSGHSRRTLKMRNKIAILEAKLAYTQNQSNLHTK